MLATGGGHLRDAIFVGVAAGALDDVLAGSPIHSAICMPPLTVPRNQLT